MADSTPNEIPGDPANFGAPRKPPMSWAGVAALVVLGLSLCAGGALAVASVVPKPRVEPTPPVDAALLAQGVEAYERGEWEQAEQAFRKILTQAPGHARAEYYLERLALTRKDAERLTQAEEALVAGDPHRASQLALAVAPNSPLFAQAERVARSAQDLLARNAQAPRARASEAAERPLDVTVALGEALALYEAGSFDAAVERATGLAEQAQPSVRAELLDWAQDARRFAQRYQALPRDDANLARHSSDVMEAVTLDERLSDGHYARELRVRMANALATLAEVLFDQGQHGESCARAQEAAAFATRHERVDALSHRCENEAFKRIAQAREIERAHPEQAVKLYRQAETIAFMGSASHRAAQAAIKDLEWSQPSTSPAQPRRP
jgi:tetratricopeptide (TPR) repeat protein